MSSIYIHVPFCKQACHYCDFHFSTSLKHKDAMLAAMIDEIGFRQSELQQQPIETIYLGGGTPSLLTADDINRIIDCVIKNHKVVENPEITLEANPDDLTLIKIQQLAASPINRLSIGVQSFFEQDLQLMNRAHNATEALSCIKNAQNYFDNLSIDLIYGIPNMNHERWRENLYTTIELKIPHISSYALTVEDNTALQSFIEKGLVPQVDDQLAHEHYHILIDLLQLHGYVNYEFSNFGKKDYFSRNNTAYWTGKPYLGIGPSAHSYDGQHRSWNISNNIKYIKSIQQGIVPKSIEKLSNIDRYNEYVMTGLRTIHGISLSQVQEKHGLAFKKYLLEQAQEAITDHLLYIDGDYIKVTRNGKFLSDGIASQLFMLNLNS